MTLPILIKTMSSNRSAESARLLLHICCAPCATTVIKRLQQVGYEVYGYFYNPNIHPEKEYYQRLLETQRICQLWAIPLEVGEYDWDRYEALIRGLEAEKEGGKRCLVCYRYRLEAAAQKAKELGIKEIATTLTISPHKPAIVINQIGKEVCEELELKFYEADWKKKDGFKQSIETCKELNIYRQNYCGCKYSIRPVIAQPPKVLTENKVKPETKPKSFAHLTESDTLRHRRTALRLKKKKTKPWRKNKRV